MYLIFKDHHQHQHQQQHHHHHHDRYDKYNSSINPGPTTIHIPLKVDSSETSSTSAYQQQQQQQAKSTNVPQEVQSIWQQLHEDGSSTEQLIIPINFKVRQVNGSHNKQSLTTMSEEEENLNTPGKQIFDNSSKNEPFHVKDTSNDAETNKNLITPV